MFSHISGHFFRVGDIITHTITHWIDGGLSFSGWFFIWISNLARQEAHLRNKNWHSSFDQIFKEQKQKESLKGPYKTEEKVPKEKQKKNMKNFLKNHCWYW